MGSAVVDGQGPPARTDRLGAAVDWRMPEGVADDWLYGAGATGAERAIVNAASVVGVAVVAAAWLVDGLAWAWWQILLAALLAVDLFGGAVANALGAAKRQYHGPPRPSFGPGSRLLRNPTAFAALHGHPFLVAAVYGTTTASWWWAAGLYAAAVGGTLAVTRAPLYLARPAAMLVFVAAVPVLGLAAAPPGWGWLPAVFLAKLLLAHAVREEPYRPAPGT